MNFQFDKFITDMNKLNRTINNRQLKKDYFQDTSLNNNKINVIRTLPFEYIESLLPPFLQIWGAQANFSYSDYDTALSHITLDEQSDLQIIWMDWRLYVDKMSPKETVDWLKSRIYSIESKKPILINNWPTFLHQEDILFSPTTGNRNWFRHFNYLLQQLSEEYSKLVVIDLDYLASKKGLAIYDSRNDQISSFPFSNNFIIDIARHFALNLLPAIFQPRLKAVILDLDNTLYSGVLGEDGVDGIKIDEGHVELQKTLLALKNSGIILAISSKNDYQDVIELIEKRKDFLINEKDLTFIEANWRDKASNIASIIDRINIDASAVLFIDDNLAEISQVKSKHPDLHVILADIEGKETVHRLLNYPGLYAIKKDEAANIRQTDILANQKRNELLSNSESEMDYLDSLKMKIEIYENNLNHVHRVHELSNKTNQFNLGLKRYSLNDVEQFIKSQHIKIYTIELSDILSNSGVIGIFICEMEDNHVVIRETLFSCRALGRQVESSSLLHILRRIQEYRIETVSFDAVEGSKNGPGLEWLTSLDIGEQCKLSNLISLLEERLYKYSAEVRTHYE